MEDLIELAVEQGGIVALLIIIVVVLWLQLTRRSVPKEGYEHLLRRLDAVDEDLREGVIPSLRQLYEAQKLTQDTLTEMRRDREVERMLSRREGIGMLDEDAPRRPLRRRRGDD